MKTLIAGLLVLAASVVLALLVKEDNGYLLLGYGHWTVEGSLAFFLLLDLLLFLFLYLSLRALANLRAAAPLVRGRLMGYALNAAVLGVAFSYPESISPWSTAAGLLVMNVSIVATEVLSQVGRATQSEAPAQQRSG